MESTKEPKTTVVMLVKMLSILQDVTISSRHWDIVLKIVDRIALKSAEVLQSEWCDSYQIKYGGEIDLGNLKTWQAIEENIKLKFSLEDGRLACGVVIYESYYRGQRHWLKARIAFEDAFIEVIRSAVESNFASHLDHEHEQYLAAKRIGWMQKKGQDLLNNPDYHIESWR